LDVAVDGIRKVDVFVVRVNVHVVERVELTTKEVIQKSYWGSRVNIDIRTTDYPETEALGTMTYA
jgi:hypothetical protein